MASLDPDDPRAPYLQVAGGLRTAIRSGEYVPGAQLPTYQDLAERWGVAINTVKSALTLLRDEGLVVTQHGKGSYVRSTPIREVKDVDILTVVEGRDDARLWQAIADLRRRVTELEGRLEP